MGPSATKIMINDPLWRSKAPEMHWVKCLGMGLMRYFDSEKDSWMDETGKKPNPLLFDILEV